MLVHLKTLGCRLNEAELETWGQGFQKSGHLLTRDAKDAQVIVINSCAVTHDAARKSRQLIRRVHRENPNAKLVVSGCHATLNQDEVAQTMGVDLVVANQHKHQLVERTLSELDFSTMPMFSAEPGEVSLFSRGRQRAFIKVQEGCRYRCAFCIVTVARGEEKSRAIADVLEEINALQRQGVNEVILTGVHLGGYGSDLGSNLSDLVRTVLEQTDVPRIRLGSLEPWEFTDDFFELFQNPRIMPHLHLPLQSGTDSVLRRMARRCKTREFAAIARRLRDTVANFNLTTDIIVGFPGETEQEWQESLDFIRQTGFGHIHIFSYSKRTGTKAAGLPGQVPDTVKKQRSQELHALAAGLKRQFLLRNTGSEHNVLWEAHSVAHNENEKLVFGYAPNYVRVACRVDKEADLANQILNSRLTRVQDDYLLAELQ